jgi:hypothetical protein
VNRGKNLPQSNARLTPAREELINVKFADVLNALGLVAEAETIQKTGRPDVLIDICGLQFIIEGRINNQRTRLFSDTKRRLEGGMCQISLALLYPDILYSTPQNSLEDEIRNTKFSGCLFFFSAGKLVESEFHDLTVDQIGDIVRRSVFLLVRNDVLRTQIAAVEEAISNSVRIASKSNLFFRSEALLDRLEQALAISKGNNGRRHPAISEDDDG